ncbi:MAG TPA: hypothetical protein DEO86_10170 [Colwellia sp.]|nr:hypothetical protein [Colwellia sp.]
MQVLSFLTLIIFPFSLVLGFVCFIKAIYFFVKAVQNTTSTAFDNLHTKITPVNVIWYPNCLNETGKVYRLKSFKFIALSFLLWVGTIALAQVVSA